VKAPKIINGKKLLLFNNGVDGTGFGGTSQGGKHRITLWKSDDGVAWEKVATSDGSNIDDVVVVP